MLEQTTGSDRGRRTGVRRALRSRLGGWLALCDDTVVQIYGPYPPSRGRSRWRLQVYDPATRRKLSITAPSSLDAERLKVELEIELKRSKPLLVHEAIDQYLEVKRPDYRDPAEVENLGKILRQFVPDGPVLAVTAAKAERYYADEVGRPGRSGKARAAVTHQKRLALVKSFWAWLVRRGLASPNNPWVDIRPVGKANSGKPQPREGDARLLDKHLFEAASEDEGALALLVQLYLGLRPSEVLGLTVGAIEDCSNHETVVYVDGKKNKNAKRKLELYGPVAALLIRFCEGRPKSQRIFASNREQQPRANWMYKRLRLRLHCDAIGIPPVCPHALRGLHSSLALAAGATTHSVAQALGHASFSTTTKHYATPDSIDLGKSRSFAKAMKRDSPEPIDKLLAELPEDLRKLVLESMAKRQ